MLHERTKSYILGLDDAGLLEYVMTGERMYEPEAIAFAREELERRDLTAEQMAAVRPGIVGKIAQLDVEAVPDLMKPREVGSILCQACGLEAPNRFVEYQQNIGLVIMRVSKSYHGYFCRKCNHRFFWKSTLITLVFGWWGLVSMIVAIPFLLGNVVTFLRTLTLPRVPADAIRPVCDEEVIERIGPHVGAITDRLTAGVDVADICREIAPVAGLTPGQVWGFMQELLKRQSKAPVAKWLEEHLEIHI